MGNPWNKSLASRILEFFKNNPDEELTFEDAQIKFDVPPNRLHMAIGRMRDRKPSIESVRVIRIRPNIPWEDEPDPKMAPTTSIDS